MSTPKGPLRGIRVLDFGRFIAGPMCATLLADYGADVIRIEKVSGSEDRYVWPIADTGEGAMFLHMGRNKRGMTLNPMKPEGRKIVEQLVATADVVVANLPPDTLKKMGLDYQSLIAIKADIILTTASAFGSGGPFSDKVGFDGVAQAMSGAMHMTGHADEPMRSAVPWVDYSTAYLTAFGTLAAVLERNKTGIGQVVEGSLLDSAMTATNYMQIEHAVTGVHRQASGNRSQNGAPSDVFQCSDGQWVLVQIIGQPLFKRWCDLVDEPHWLEDPRFANDQARGDNGSILSQRMSTWTSSRTMAQVLAALEQARIPAGEVLTPEQALDHPHVIAKGFHQAQEFPGLAKPAPIASPPVQLSATPGGIHSRAPVLGEHTDSILLELGYNTEQIKTLHSNRIV